jgi:hypothetical protein
VPFPEAETGEEELDDPGRLLCGVCLRGEPSPVLYLIPRTLDGMKTILVVMMDELTDRLN